MSNSLVRLPSDYWPRDLIHWPGSRQHGLKKFPGSKIQSFKTQRSKRIHFFYLRPLFILYVALWIFVNLVSLQSWVAVKATRSVHRRSTKKCSKQFDSARSRVLKSVETVLHTGQQQNLTSYYRCTTKHIYSIYLEPKWPLFLKVKPPQKQGPFPSKQGAPFGFQVTLDILGKGGSRMNG